MCEVGAVDAQRPAVGEPAIDSDRCVVVNSERAGVVEGAALRERQRRGIGQLEVAAVAGEPRSGETSVAAKLDEPSSTKVSVLALLVSPPSVTVVAAFSPY